MYYSNILLGCVVLLLRFLQGRCMLPCRVLGVVILLLVGPCPGVEFGMPLVVEHRDVSENLEFLHHVASVPVEFVDVLDEPCDVVRYGGQFRQENI